MINVCIYGGTDANSGELVRLLLNHPEVDEISVYEPSRRGESLSQYHYGLIGERPLNYTEQLSLDDYDVIFLTASDEGAEKLATDDTHHLKVIDLRDLHRLDHEDVGLAYGLSEVNRKGLVRGQERAVIPSALAALSLIALYPLAANLLLNQDIELSATGRLFSPQEESRQEILGRLKIMQNSFTHNVSISHRESEQGLGLRVRFTINSGMSHEDLKRVYEEIYDDHNFTYIVNEPRNISEVTGTQKCVISLRKTSPDVLEVEAIADAFLRGGAGDAVHVMNLLCGLQEKTGLALKAFHKA